MDKSVNNLVMDFNKTFPGSSSSRQDPQTPSTSPTLNASSSKKLLITSDNWAVVDVTCKETQRAGSVPLAMTPSSVLRNGREWCFRTNNSTASEALMKSANMAAGLAKATSNVKRNRPPPQQTVMFKSGLTVKMEMNSPQYNFFRGVSEETPNGYTETNSIQALKRFVKRGLVEVVQSTVHECAKRQMIAELVVNVPSLNVGAAKFSGIGASEIVAERKCALKALTSLYANSVIKEANVEFHKRRKAFMDSSKDLDLKLQGYLNSNPVTFSKILDQIASHKEYFDR